MRFNATSQSLLRLLAVFMVLSLGSAAQAPNGLYSPARPELRLWAGAAPGSESNPPGEITKSSDKDIAGRPVKLLTNVSDPTITLYSAKEKNTGAAVLVFPGGGYWVLAIDLEGTEVCEWLNSFGVNCILLKYRVPKSGPYPKSAAALEDAQRAMRLVRRHAAEWDIDPHRVGVLGFSAGGHLAAALSSQFDNQVYAPVDDADKLSCRPDFAVLVYPAYLALPQQNFAINPDVRPGSNAPPSFIVQAEDDPVHAENAANYFLALKSASVPAELHIYAQGGHGYGLRRTDLPVTTWPDAVPTWLRSIKMLP